MCLMVFAWRSHPDYPLILAANRDEFYSRAHSTCRVVGACGLGARRLR